MPVFHWTAVLFLQCPYVGTVIKSTHPGAGELALAALREDLGSGPASTLDGSQLPEIPVPGYLKLSSGLFKHLHSHGTHTQAHTHKNKTKSACPSTGH